MTNQTAKKVASVIAMMKAGAKLYRPNWRDYGQLVTDNPDNPRRVLVHRVSAVVLNHLLQTGAIKSVESQVGKDRYELRMPGEPLDYDAPECEDMAEASPQKCRVPGCRNLAEEERTECQGCRRFFRDMIDETGD
jgi:hypothetical protein